MYTNTIYHLHQRKFRRTCIYLSQTLGRTRWQYTCTVASVLVLKCWTKHYRTCMSYDPFLSVPSINWAMTWQNQQNECAQSEYSDQLGHPPSMIRVFVLSTVGYLGTKLSSIGQRRLWSRWADACNGASLRHFIEYMYTLLKGSGGTSPSMGLGVKLCGGKWF